MPEVDQRIRLLMELRRQGITDTPVLGAIEKTPRDRFIDQSMRHRAWENIPLPILQGQTISQPYIVAFMTQNLELDAKKKILEIGTGSGYQAAVLAQICRRVYTIERHRSLYLQARRLFEDLGLHRIVTLYGDGMKGWPQQAPFDRIIVTAAALQDAPAMLLSQLAPGGLMLAPIGESAANQNIVRFRKDDGGVVSRENILPVRFVPLLPGISSGR